MVCDLEQVFRLNCLVYSQSVTQTLRLVRKHVGKCPKNVSYYLCRNNGYDTHNSFSKSFNNRFCFALLYS